MIIIMKPEATTKEIKSIVQRLHSSVSHIKCTWLNGRAIIVATGNN